MSIVRGENYEIFEHELQVLSRAEDIINQSKSKQHEWITDFEQLKNEYEKLLKLTKKVFQISDIQGKELKQREIEILNLVNKTLESQAQVEYLSYHDSLTSAFNRTYADKVFADLTVEQFPISIIMADLNGLKLTNDVFGHEKGDRLLVRTYETLKTCCRDTDVVFRWGGDEFIILLPQTDQKKCSEIIEHIQQSCKETDFDPIKVYLAIGAETLTSTNEKLQKTIKTAEKHMYKQKLLESKQIRKAILSDIQNILIQRGIEKDGHSNRILKMLEQLNQLAGGPSHPAWQEKLSLLAILHDVGKVLIPYDILQKGNLLSQEEWEILKSHNEFGYRMAQSIGEPEVAEAILLKDESWDGSGYPFGLKGNSIPALSRMLAVVHYFDELTQENGHFQQPLLSPDQAVKNLCDQSEIKFDPNYVNLFITHIDEFLFNIVDNKY